MLFVKLKNWTKLKVVPSPRWICLKASISTCILLTLTRVEESGELKICLRKEPTNNNSNFFNNEKTLRDEKLDNNQTKCKLKFPCCLLHHHNFVKIIIHCGEVSSWHQRKLIEKLRLAAGFFYDSTLYYQAFYSSSFFFTLTGWSQRV